MATLALVISLAVLLASSSAQAEETVWSSVAFILHGERTPVYSTNSGWPALTPLGAQQLYGQGSMFRARYLQPNANFTDDVSRVTTHAPINGIQNNAIDNTQLWVTSSTDQYTTGSAQAFLQALYPPRNQTYSSNAGGIAAAVLSNGTLLNYPLDGYQYSNVQTLSTLDPTSIWLEGNVACTMLQESMLEFRDSPQVQQVYNSTLDFYQSMWPKIFQGTFTKDMTNFYYAYELYEHAQYQWNHKQGIENNITSNDLDMLRMYASLEQRDVFGNLSASGLVEGDMIRAVAGRTLAAKVVAQMKANIASGGTGEKLNLMFGSYEPFVSFFALAGLVNGPSRGDFTELPSSGAAMMWELFSVDTNNSVYPANDDLWVRFLYRNSTDADAPFTEYPLFGLSNSEDRMRWPQFQTEIESISVDSIADWCNMCDSSSLYCSALADNSQSGYGSGSSSDKGLSPAVAGVVGAVIAIAVIGVAATAAAVLGGYRVHRSGPGRRNSTLGGFKGAEKMASDTDVTVVNGGARHERTGSWELRDGNSKTDSIATTGAVVTKDFSRSSAKDIDDDAISEMNAVAVKPREEV